MFLLEVESADTLLECKQGLIDLGAVQSRLPVLVDGIGAALATCQIDEAHLSKLTVRIGLRPELELEDGVGARRVGVGASDTAGSLLQSMGHDLHYCFDRGNSLLGQAYDIHPLLAVFATVQQDAFVEEIIQFSTVDLVETNEELEVREASEELDNVEGGK